MKSFIIPLALALAVAAPAVAQNNPPAATEAMSTVVDPALFVTMAGVSNLFEIQSSEVALERSENSDVQAFAQRMIDDHTAATERLQQVATEQGLEVPAELDATHQT